jgi:hypothetical protein
MPLLRSPGVITFADPEERSTQLTREGPVSRVTWRWTIKPALPRGAVLQAVKIPWFDTTARMARDVVLTAERVAPAGADYPGPDGKSTHDDIGAVAIPMGTFLGLLCGLALLVPGLRLRTRTELTRFLTRLLPDRHSTALRRAAREGDTRAVRLAAHRMILHDAAQGSYRSREAAIQSRLASLDRILFDPKCSGVSFDLATFVRDLMAARRAASRDCRTRAGKWNRDGNVELHQQSRRSEWSKA